MIKFVIDLPQVKSLYGHFGYPTQKKKGDNNIIEIHCSFENGV